MNKIFNNLYSANTCFFSLLSLSANLFLVIIINYKLGEDFIFYVGLPFGVVFAILLTLYILYSRRIELLSIISNIITLTLLMLWVANVARLQLNTPSSLDYSYELALPLAIVFLLFWLIYYIFILHLNTIYSYTLLYLGYTSIAATAYALDFSLIYFSLYYIISIIIFNGIILFKIISNNSTFSPKNSVVTPIFLLYLITLILFMINECYIHTPLNAILQPYKLLERALIIKQTLYYSEISITILQLFTNSHSTITHKLVIVEWELKTAGVEESAINTLNLFVKVKPEIKPTSSFWGSPASNNSLTTVWNIVRASIWGTANLNNSTPSTLSRIEPKSLDYSSSKSSTKTYISTHYKDSENSFIFRYNSLRSNYVSSSTHLTYSTQNIYLSQREYSSSRSLITLDSALEETELASAPDLHNLINNISLKDCSLGKLKANLTHNDMMKGHYVLVIEINNYHQLLILATSPDINPKQSTSNECYKKMFMVITKGKVKQRL